MQLRRSLPGRALSPILIGALALLPLVLPRAGFAAPIPESAEGSTSSGTPAAESPAEGEGSAEEDQTTKPPVTPPAAASKDISPGGLPKKAISDVIHSHGPDIKRCYDERLKIDSELEGMVVSYFTIGPDGSVIEAEFETTIDDPLMVACVSELLVTWVFPPPQGGGNVQVEYPWLFRKQGSNFSVSEGLDMMQVSRSLREQRSVLETCYQQWLLDNPNNSSLKLRGQWEITLDGSVTAFQIGDSKNAYSTLSSCLSEGMQTIRFPSPSAKKWVTVSNFPLRFSSQMKTAPPPSATNETAHGAAPSATSADEAGATTPKRAGAPAAADAAKTSATQ